MSRKSKVAVSVEDVETDSAQEQADPVSPTIEAAASASAETLIGYGIDKAKDGGWLAYRITTGGEVSILSPRRGEGYRGEQKHSALARAHNAFRAEFTRAK